MLVGVDSSVKISEYFCKKNIVYKYFCEKYL